MNSLHGRGNKRRILATLIVSGLLTGSSLAAPQNILKGADFSKLKPGSAPGNPWALSKMDKAVGIRAESPAGEGPGWVLLFDDNPKAGASMRQQFPEVPMGRLAFTVKVGEENAAGLGVYLGNGNLSAPPERVIDFKSNAKGTVVIGSRGERGSCPLKLAPGTTRRVFIEWKENPETKTTSVWIGEFNDKGYVSRDEILMPVASDPISSVRFTTDSTPVGGRLYLSNISIVSLPAPYFDQKFLTTGGM